MSNTKFSYAYRDASNYKQYESIILAGEISKADIDIILNKLVDTEFFIPKQVGLPALQPRFGRITIDDHIFHELHREDISPTSELPTTHITVEELVDRFRTVEWDIVGANEDLYTE